MMLQLPAIVNVDTYLAATSSRLFWLLSSSKIILSLMFSQHSIRQNDIIPFKNGERKLEKPKKFEKKTS